MKLSNKHKLFVDKLFLNGFNQADAYKEVYGVNKDQYAAMAASRLMRKDEVKDYYDHRMKEYRKSLDIDKQKMLDMLMDELNLFNEMKALANKEKLTASEEGRFVRLTMLLKGSDAARTRDMINRLQGNYEADRQEITHKMEQPLFGPEKEQENEEEEDEQ